jgi:cytidine deaminase
MKLSTDVEKAHKLAVKSLKNSHSPYSRLRVASALKIKSQKEPICGVNVENASFGATICAERSALVSAQSQFGKMKVEFIVIISDFKGGPIPPCGMCLQFLSELADPSLPIFLGDSKKIHIKQKLKDFLPLSFSKKMLPQIK